MRIESLYEGAALALDQLRANKFRSTLTILGIVVGVATVMAMSAIISGVRKSVLESMAAAGPENFMIMRFDMNKVRLTNNSGPPWGDNPPITTEEVRRIARLDKLRSAIPGVDANSSTVEYGAGSVENVSIAGRGAGWAAFAPGTFVAGHDFLPADVRAAARVVIVSPHLAETLFGPLDPIGRWVRINGQPFRVVGVYDIADNLFAAMAKNLAIVPYTSAMKYLEAWDEMLGVFAVAASNASQEEAMEQVITTLRTARGLRAGQENNFALIRQEQMVQTFNRITGVFFVVMIALSSVGLMVGGVGVIAIMMIAVTERTREIGIRKALGATQREILWQFLFEAATLTVVGGAIGMIIGGGAAFLVKSVTPIPANVPFGAIVAALAMAVVAGILFGLWPAWRAARMDPVVALRFE